MDLKTPAPRRKRRTKADATTITAIEIQNVAPGAVLTLGGGLSFRATGRNDATGKTFGRWTFRFTSGAPDFVVEQERTGSKTRQREKGLGAFPAVSLKDARAEAVRLYAQVCAGIDPIEQERRERAARLDTARLVRLGLALSAATDARPAASDPAQVWGGRGSHPPPIAPPCLGAAVVISQPDPSHRRLCRHQPVRRPVHHRRQVPPDSTP